MPIKRLTVFSVLAAAALVSGPVFASPSGQSQASPAVATITPPLMSQFAALAPAQMLSQSALPAAPAIEEQASNADDLRKTLIDLAMQLRDIRDRKSVV